MGATELPPECKQQRLRSMPVRVVPDEQDFAAVGGAGIEADGTGQRVQVGCAVMDVGLEIGTLSLGTAVLISGYAGRGSLSEISTVSW